ncbi:MAG: FAD-dependent oxidoreductase [Planctomycetota bacterium]
MSVPFVEDFSPSALVVVADAKRWRTVLRPAVSWASLPDGRSLEPERVDPRSVSALSANRTLDLLEVGALLVVDLASLAPGVLDLLSWHARARSSTTMFLHVGEGDDAFAFHEFLVRSYQEEGDRAASSRLEIATRATVRLRSRPKEGPAGLDLASVKDNLTLRQRRDENGIGDAVKLADRDLLEGNVGGALNGMEAALRVEPDASDLLLRTALLHRVQSRWGPAIRLLERAVAIHPASIDAWRELGIARERGGASGAEEALRRALDRGEDFETLVALAHLLSRQGDTDEAGRLLERAMERSGWQLNLVLPTLELRTGRTRRIYVSPQERVRVERVLAIRGPQAETDPPEDAPWSCFDASRALLFLGREEEALAHAARARDYLTAPWQTATFGRFLSLFERAGPDVAPFRRALGIRADQAEEDRDRLAQDLPPYRAALRPPGWYVENVPCMHACPVGTDAGTYVHLLARGRFEDAYRVARGPNPFASVCGRICAAPWEDACRRGRIDEAVEIRSLKRFLTERLGVESPDSRLDRVLDGSTPPCIEGDAYISRLRKIGAGTTTGHRVAVVGGGPAGLAAAHDLAFLGHHVTLFEASDHLGGMMRHGIPVYRLPRDILDREIATILALGVEVRLEEGLSGERTLADLLAGGFEAVILASGAGRGRFLDVEGAELDGVVRAIEFLINLNEGFQMALGSRVVVIGGGNVAMDVARTARRGRPPRSVGEAATAVALEETFGPALQGRALWGRLEGETREVHVVARQPLGAWPAQRSVRGMEEVEEAMEEGVLFHPLRGVRRFLGKDGKLTAVELAEVIQLQDEHGRYAPVYGALAAETIPCDTVFLAVGQEPDLDYLAGTGAVRRTSRGLIEVVAETLATSMPGVYAAGDAAFGPRTLIEAVSDGKRAARNVHAYFAKGRTLPVRYTFEEVLPRTIPARADYDHLPRKSPPTVAVERRTGIAEVEGGFDEAAAVFQASRCLVCHVQTVYDGDLCIACGRCTEVCPFACLTFASPEDVEVPGLDPRAMAAAGRGRGPVLMLKDEERCIRCGLCAQRCPTGAMTMEMFQVTVEEPTS